MLQLLQSLAHGAEQLLLQWYFAGLLPIAGCGPADRLSDAYTHYEVAETLLALLHRLATETTADLFREKRTHLQGI